MWEALKRLLSPEYLAVADPGPMGGLWVLYVALGLLFAAGLAWSAWLVASAAASSSARSGPQGSQSHEGGRTASTAGAMPLLAWLELWICLAGLATVVGRFLGWPGWSARIWPYSLAVLAVAGAAVIRWRDLPIPPGPPSRRGKGGASSPRLADSPPLAGTCPAPSRRSGVGSVWRPGERSRVALLVLLHLAG
ncbi:MAG: hypothetical protein RBU35_17025, partial [Anaerolineae bacterium]|nr:hypothetical protein [Anaerolineae bacterium]